MRVHIQNTSRDVSEKVVQVGRTEPIRTLLENPGHRINDDPAVSHAVHRDQGS